ncbi:MAG: asparagine synthetase A [Candidatus Aenigmarchaeota archaeon]|nr:asparagine synthetase A [Candidatus Aenigmarchaeota archaeon]MDW8149664.1 asparagine synthetase A [Candidatus Aenigmarchaeota archaeon]
MIEFTKDKFKNDIFKIVSNPTMQKVYEIYDKVSSAMREFLNKNGFLEFKAILIGPATDPGIRGAKQVSIDYYGHEYKIMSSAILYKQLLSIARKHSGNSGKIYLFGDNIRLEPVERMYSDRHLVEFIQVDLEVAGIDHFEAMKIAENLFVYVCKKLKKYENTLMEIWKFFEPEWELHGLKPRKKLKIPKIPFKKITHKEAIDMIKEFLEKDPEVLKKMETMFKLKPEELSYSKEIPLEYEWLISYMHDEPFFVYDYPKTARGFYDREYPNKPGILMDFDMILPDGYGEVISGAAREFEVDKVIVRMKESGEDAEKYKWYLEFLKKHGEPTAGFGIGLERTVRYICALPTIYFSIPCPRIPGIVSP